MRVMGLPCPGGASVGWSRSLLQAATAIRRAPQAVALHKGWMMFVFMCVMGGLLVKSKDVVNSVFQLAEGGGVVVAVAAHPAAVAGGEHLAISVAGQVSAGGDDAFVFHLDDFDGRCHVAGLVTGRARGGGCIGGNTKGA